MAMRRVLFVSAVADFKGGAETCLKQFLSNPNVSPLLVVPAEGELSQYAKNNSIPVEVVSFGRVHSVKRPLKLLSVFLAFIDAFKAGKKIKELASKYSAECIHSNGLKTHGIMALASILGGTPVVCHIHDIPYTAKEKIFWRVLALSCKCLILVSRHCWASKKLPSNVKLVPNGISIHGDSLTEKQLETELSIGFIGRIHPYKGLLLAVEWLAKAYQHGYKFQFYIRGEAAPADSGYEGAVRELIAVNGLEHLCHFEGRLDDYSEVYEGLDITLMPSVVAEPFGLVAIESFDQGVVCFAYPSGALPSIIEHGVSGYLCQTSDDFLRALGDLTMTEGKFQSIRFNAKSRLKDKYSLASVHCALNDIYTSISERG